jgi:hypothetical protein
MAPEASEDGAGCCGERQLNSNGNKGVLLC